MSGDDERNSFVRGMTIGAIIGAVVAGSSLWSRRRRRTPRALEASPEHAGPDPANEVTLGEGPARSEVAADGD